MRYDGDDKLLDTENDAVMMDWEAPLMKRHAEVGFSPAGSRVRLSGILVLGGGEAK